MSVTRGAVLGVAWVAGSNWLQLGLAAGSFTVVAVHLGPARLGLYGAAMLVISAVQAVLGGPLNESLEQREEIHRDHVNATFWISLLLSVVVAAGLIAFARPIMGSLGAPDGAPLLAWLAAGLPLGAVSGVARALLIRDLRFRESSQIGAGAQIAASLSAIGAVLLGAGVWALVISTFASQLVNLGGFLRASRFRPGPPRRLHAMSDLVRFNLHTLVTYLLGYADRSAPRIITSALLGTQSLGYLMIAGRVFEMISQLVLSPLSAVTMTSVARLQADPTGLRKLLLSLYQLAALVAYPAFLGAIVITPALAGLAGQKWAPAVLTIQIMLLLGLRTTTGAFNVGILRGLGRTRAPFLLLGLGVALQIAFCPIGVAFGSAGVAAAMLARSFATWPLGCWLVKRASGLSIREQLGTGTPALIAALIMAAVSWGALREFGGQSAWRQLAVGVGAGVLIYPLALSVVSSKARRIFGAAFQALLVGGRSRAIRDLRAEFGL